MQTKARYELELQVETLDTKLTGELVKNTELKENIERMAVKVKDLEEANGLAMENIGKLLTEIAGSKEWIQEERNAKENAWKELKDLQLEHQRLNGVKVDLDRQVEGKNISISKKTSLVQTL